MSIDFLNEFEEVKSDYLDEKRNYEHIYDKVDRIVNDTYQSILEVLELNEWKVIKSNEKYKTCSGKFRNSRFKVFKGEQTIRIQNKNLDAYSIAKVLSYLAFIYQVQPNLKKQIDPQCVYQRLLHVIPNHKDRLIFHGRYGSGVFCVSDRDTLYFRDIIVDETGETAYYLSQTIDDDEEYFPRDKSCVRGLVTFYGWVIQKINDNGEFKVSIFFHGDLKGMIPSWLYNKTMDCQVEIISRMSDWFESEDFSKLVRTTEKD